MEYTILLKVIFSVCACVHVCHSMCVAVRGLLVGIGSLLPCGPLGLNSGHRAWQQVPLPTESYVILCNDLLRVIATPMCSVDVGTCVCLLMCVCYVHRWESLESAECPASFQASFL